MKNKQNKKAPYDKKGKLIQLGDILKYTNEKWPEKTQPLHGVRLYKGKIVPTIPRGKHYKSWKPMDQPFCSPPSRWEIIGNYKDNPELVLKDNQ